MVLQQLYMGHTNYIRSPTYLEVTPRTRMEGTQGGQEEVRGPGLTEDLLFHSVC